MRPIVCLTPFLLAGLVGLACGPACGPKINPMGDVTADANGTGSTGSNGCISAQVGYSAVAPVIQSNCLSCHTSGQTPLLGTYALAKAGFATGGGKEAVASGTMPVGQSLSANDRCLLSNWEAGGYAP